MGVAQSAPHSLVVVVYRVWWVCFVAVTIVCSFSASLYTMYDTVLSVCSFCSGLKPTEHAQLLRPLLPHYLRWLCEMSGEYSDDVVSLVVDSLQLVAQVGVA